MPGESPAKVIVNRGALRLARGDVDGAEALYREAISVDPGNPTAHANLGYVLALTDRHDEAMGEAEEALAIEPGRSAPWAHLGMSQPSVSEAIASLEQTLRVRLLERKAQGVEPTIYADVFLKRGQVAFDEIRQGIMDIESLANPEVGEVRIACPEFLSADLLPRAISRFSRRYPKVVFNVVHPDTMTLDNHELQQRKVDITLARIPHTFRDEDLNVEMLFDDPHCVIAGTNSRWARRRSIALIELAEEPWVLPPTPVIYNLVQAEFKARGREMSSVTISAFSVFACGATVTRPGRMLSS